MGEHKIPDTTPRPWRPGEIVFCQLTFKGDVQNPQFSGGPVQVFGDMPIERFLDLWRRDALPKGEERPRRPGTSNLDIPIKGPTQPYVVLELLDETRWRFPPNGVAITTKKPQGDRNFGLKHVQKRASDLGQALAGPERFVLAYYGVAERDEGEPQLVNYHVSLRNPAGGWVNCLIDPDVPNEGLDIPDGRKGPVGPPPGPPGPPPGGSGPPGGGR